MAKKTADRPAMQDLSDPWPLIAQAFKRLAPPGGPFDPDGTWTHVYQGHINIQFQARPGRPHAQA